jgi:hypothetical protein
MKHMGRLLVVLGMVLGCEGASRSGLSSGATGGMQATGGTAGVTDTVATGGSVGTGGTGGVPGAGGAIAFEDVEREVVRAMCVGMTACGDVPDQGSCEATRRGLFLDEIAAVMRGASAYDAGAARACVDARLAADCAPERSVEPCRRIFVGRVALGGACVINEECAPGSACATSRCEGGCCYGTCVADTSCWGLPCGPLPTTGARCHLSKGCQPPAACQSLTDSMAYCTVLPVEGEACNPSSWPDCSRRDTFCDPGSLRCVRKRQPGEGCRSQHECDRGAICPGTSINRPGWGGGSGTAGGNGGAGGGVGICRALGTLGQACGGDDDCWASLICTAGACGSPPTRSTACVPQP